MNARIRSLTKPKLLTQAKVKGVLGEFIAIMDIQLDDAVDNLHSYPPPKPDSRYERTGDYGAGWYRTDTRLTGGELIGEIHNNVYYAMRVGGDEQGLNQLGMHHDTRWPLMAEVLRDGYVKKMRKAIKEFL